MSAVVGVLLAGGQSMRMGRDKALLEYAGEPQVVRGHRLLSAVCSRVLVSVRPDQAARMPVSERDLVVDEDDDAGPAAGLLAAWRRVPSSPLLVLAVDMPRVDMPTLQCLLEARDANALATAFEHADGTLEPLCTLWEPAAFEIVRAARERAARTRNRGVSLRRVLEESMVRRVAPPCPDCLRSINLPEEYAAVGDLPEP